MSAEKPDETSDRHTDPQLESEQLRSAARGLATAAYVMIGSVLAGLGIGWTIDRIAGTSPTWMLILLAVFTIAGLYHLIRDARR